MSWHRNPRPRRTPRTPSGPARRAGQAARPSRLLLILFAVCTLVLGLSACSSDDGPSTQEGYVGGSGGLTVIPPADREPAPMVSGPDLAGDGTVSLADYEGQVIVLNVWGSWCAPCRKEAPDLVAAAEQTQGKAQFVGLDTRDLDKAQGQAFVRTFEIPYPNIFDPQGRLLLEFSGVIPPSGIPTTLVIDAEGRVAARVIGTVNTTTLVGLVDDISAGK